MLATRVTLQRPIARLATTHVVHIAKPCKTIQNLTRPKAFYIDNVSYAAEQVSFFVGKGIILFTMFYCTLNWQYYRGLRKEVDEAAKAAKEAKEAKTSKDTKRQKSKTE